MKYIFLILVLGFELFGAVIKSPVVSVNENETEVTIKIEKINVGMSGFIVHKIADNHTTILKNAVIVSFDEDSKIATLKLSEYNIFGNSALPTARWHVEVGDTVLLAFGYTRGLLIAPTEEIYYRIAKHSNVQWVHPDIFATNLSFSGHPTPLREDFTKISVSSSVGLVYIYLDNVVYSLDAKSFKILTTASVSLVQEKANLPFYTRISEIDSNWWGEGSNELEDYESHYYFLIAKANPKNRKLYKIIKNGDEKLQYILKEFDIKE